MDAKLVELLEDQVNKELWSAYIYLDIAEYYRAKSLDGLHIWFEKQAQEEIEHAEKFMEFLHDSDVSFALKPIAGPEKQFADLREPLAYQLEHERLVTSLIKNIYKCAHELGDVTVMKFLDWFIDEQFEEEKHSKELIEKYDRLATTGYGLYLFDKELAGRQ